MSATRSACHRNNFRKSRVSDVSARILARMSVSVSVSVWAPWNASFTVANDVVYVQKKNSMFRVRVSCRALCVGPTCR